MIPLSAANGLEISVRPTRAGSNRGRPCRPLADERRREEDQWLGREILMMMIIITKPESIPIGPGSEPFRSRSSELDTMPSTGSSRVEGQLAGAQSRP